MCCSSQCPRSLHAAKQWWVSLSERNQLVLAALVKRLCLMADSGSLTMCQGCPDSDVPRLLPLGHHLVLTLALLPEYVVHT
jgi:hypothetical protein